MRGHWIIEVFKHTHLIINFQGLTDMFDYGNIVFYEDSTFFGKLLTKNLNSLILGEEKYDSSLSWLHLKHSSTNFYLC